MKACDVIVSPLSVTLVLLCGALAWAGDAPFVEVRQHHGRPTIFIKGEPRAVTMYCPPLGSRRWAHVWRRSTRRMMQHNLDVYVMGLPQMRPRSEEDVWPPPNNFWHGDTITAQPRLQSHDEIGAGPQFVLEHAPEAYLIIRYNPHHKPDWLEQHPDHRVVNAEGEPMNVASLASRAFAQAQADYSQAVITYCESRPWGDRVIGYTNYHLSEGGHVSALRGWIFDYSRVMTRRWRAFLRGKYASLDALRQAHGDDELTFDTAEVPRGELHHQSVEQAVASLYWQSAEQNQPLRDYLELLTKLYQENFRLIAQAAYEAAPDKLHFHDSFKTTTQGRTNVGFFHPKASWPLVYPDLRVASGNMNTAALLDVSTFHGVVTPHQYYVRGAGGTSEPEGIVDSILLRGKLFIGEEDLRTYRQDDTIAESHRRQFGMIRDFQEFIAVTWRNTATALTRGFLNYYYDINNDYLDEPRMHEVLSRQFEVIKESIHWPHKTVPGIAVILDDRAMLETNASGHVLYDAVQNELKSGVSRCGVPYRVYMFEDLRLDNFPEHRVFYFPNLYRIDDDRLSLLQEKVLRDGNVVVWGAGSGISDGTHIAAAPATKATGFDFQFHPINHPRHVQIINFNHPITADLNPDTIYGSSISYGPVLYPTNGIRLGLAWSKRGGDDAGLAVKSFGRGARAENKPDADLGSGDYAGVFTTAAPLPADLWRGIARFAGAHVYTQTNDVLLASDRVVALHSLKSGPRRIHLPEPRRIHDLVTGELIDDMATEITFDLEGPQTRVFFLEPAAGTSNGDRVPTDGSRPTLSPPEDRADG